MGAAAVKAHRPFLPLDATGAAIWPPGYVPQACGTARSAARVAADMRQREHVERQRRTATGWAGNTFDMANTPHEQAAPGMLPPQARESAPGRAAADGAWRVAAHHFVWRALEVLRGKKCHRMPMTELAKRLGVPSNNMRANLARGITKGVFVVLPAEGEFRHGNERDIGLGPNAHIVQMHWRMGARGGRGPP